MADHQEIIIENIDHLGIVAGLIDEIEIVKIINEKLGVDQREKISSGQVVKALIINALGMISLASFCFFVYFFLMITFSCLIFVLEIKSLV